MKSKRVRTWFVLTLCLVACAKHAKEPAKPEPPSEPKAAPATSSQAAKDELREASGMEDDAVLEQLVRVGFSGATISTLSLLPLCEVAWADDAVSAKERDIIMTSAANKKIERDTDAFELLQSWLDKQPKSELFPVWQAYIRSLDPLLTEEQSKLLREQVVDSISQVAQAEGGISKTEHKVIGNIEATWTR